MRCSLYCTLSMLCQYRDTRGPILNATTSWCYEVTSSPRYDCLVFLMQNKVIKHNNGGFRLSNSCSRRKDDAQMNKYYICFYIPLKTTVIINNHKVRTRKKSFVTSLSVTRSPSSQRPKLDLYPKGQWELDIQWKKITSAIFFFHFSAFFLIIKTFLEIY